MSLSFLRKLKCQNLMMPNKPTTLWHYAKLSTSLIRNSFSKVPPVVRTAKNESQFLDEGEAAELKGNLGQATYQTHPHLIEPGNLVPGVSMHEFKQRRELLMTSIQRYALQNVDDSARPDKHILLVPAASKKYMSGEIPYFFRQNSDFFYFTGCLEPDSMLMLTIANSGDINSTLFMRPNDKHAEMWDGARTGTENAIKLFGVEESYPMNLFGKIFQSRLVDDKCQLWFDQETREMEYTKQQIIRAADLCKKQIYPASNFIQTMRLLKSPTEIDLMRRTCRVASQAFNEVIREAEVGFTEQCIQAMVDFKFMLDASYLAYPPVVAAGNNATILHYIDNTQLIKDGDLVLMDAGCEYGGYASDITRTWPISGVFNEPQKVLYDVVHQLQKELIELIGKPGGETLDQLFDSMCFKLGKYLQEVGLIPKHLTSEQDIIQAAFKFCPHHVSHYLGIDVHDTPVISRSLEIQPGMVFTVGPGLYIGHDRTDVPPEFRGLGLRIEDDVLINNNCEIEILTGTCIKQRTMLEELLKKEVEHL